MRHILVDHARKRLSHKRGQGRPGAELDDRTAAAEGDLVSVLAVHEAIEALAEHDDRQARVVEMRYFGGLTDEEIGLVLGVSSRTVKRDWLSAKAWLEAALRGAGGRASGG